MHKIIYIHSNTTVIEHDLLQKKLSFYYVNYSMIWPILSYTWNKLAHWHPKCQNLFLFPSLIHNSWTNKHGIIKFSKKKVINWFVWFHIIMASRIVCQRTKIIFFLTSMFKNGLKFLKSYLCKWLLKKLQMTKKF